MTDASIRQELALRLSEAQGDSLLADLFGTADARTAADAVMNLVSEFAVPSGIALVRLSSGLVVGFDGSGSGGSGALQPQRVVVKVHRGHLVPRLQAVLRAQAALGSAGLPVATALCDAPVPVGSGAALVESWRAVGDVVDVRPADRRQALARCSFAISEALGPNDFADLRPAWPGRYPPPHSPLFDFEATATGAEWIDELADSALAAASELTATGAGRLVVAHADLRPENVRLDLSGTEPRVSTVYDLDSLVTEYEAWAIGGVARAFSTNWSLSDPMMPTVTEIGAFVADYELARGCPFTSDETRLAVCGTVHSLAYSARCEHALFPDGSPAPWGPGWRSLLRRYVEAPGPGGGALASNV